MSSLLLVGLSGGIVLVLRSLVGDSVTGGLKTSEGVSGCALTNSKKEMMYSYRVPTPTLLSLATSLLASLEVAEVAPVKGDVSVS